MRAFSWSPPSLSGLPLLLLGLLLGRLLGALRLALANERDGQVGVGLGAEEEVIGAFVVAVVHRAFAVGDLLIGELRVERRLRVLVGPELAGATQRRLGRDEAVGRFGVTGARPAGEQGRSAREISPHGRPPQGPAASP